MAMNDKRYKTGNDVIDYSTDLANLEKKFHGKDDIMGVTTLTVPAYISSNRAIMFASHTKQFKTLKRKQLPRMRTNYEDVVGGNSAYLHKAPASGEVVAKIEKFSMCPGAVYYLIYYNSEEDKYYMEIKKRGVETQERFGFHINNDRMDELKVGDHIEKGETLWKSNSYDDHDLYGYGVNARVIWLIDNWTIEDAIKIRRGFLKELTTFEEETVKVYFNKREEFRDIYGDDEHYRGFPDIGEKLKKNILCATFKRINSQLLYDMKASNLREISSLDDHIFYAKSEHDARVWDVDIFCNEDMEEIPETRQNEQILLYLRNQKRFYTELHSVLDSIKQSGSDFDDDIGFWHRRSAEMLDPDSVFRKSNSYPDRIYFEFKIEREVEVDIGNKLTGRYGNKGVVSIIVDDDKMPFYKDEDGNEVPVDIVMNALGICNRLITMPLYEAELTGAGDVAFDKISRSKTMKEKEKILMNYESFFDDKKWFTRMKEYYKKLDTFEKKQFWDELNETGPIIHIPPMWLEENLFERVKRMYKEHPELNPKRTCYIRKFGRTIKMMNQLVVGRIYILVLKQTSKKGFSARSLGFVNMKGLPDKTDRLRNNLQIYSTTPIKNGIDDCNNLNIAADSYDIAKMHLLYRNSVIGRREWKVLLTGDPTNLEDIKLKPEFTNRNVEILNALLTCMGRGIEFPGDTLYLDIDDDRIETFLFDNMFTMATPKQMREIILDKYFRPKFEEKLCVGSKEEIEEMYQKYKKHQLMKRDPNIDYVYIEDNLHD